MTIAENQLGAVLVLRPLLKEEVLMPSPIWISIVLFVLGGCAAWAWMQRRYRRDYGPQSKWSAAEGLVFLSIAAALWACTGLVVSASVPYVVDQYQITESKLGMIGTTCLVVDESDSGRLFYADSSYPARLVEHEPPFRYAIRAWNRQWCMRKAVGVGRTHYAPKWQWAEIFVGSGPWVIRNGSGTVEFFAPPGAVVYEGSRK